MKNKDLEIGLMNLYKSGDGIDIKKLYEEIHSANLNFTRELEKNLLKKIEENKDKEKIEVNFEEMQNVLDEEFLPEKELEIFLKYKIFSEREVKEYLKDITSSTSETINEFLNEELKSLIKKNSEIIDIINEDEIKQKEFFINYFKELETFLKNNEKLFDTLDILDSNEDYKILFNNYIKYLSSIKEIKLEENKINDLYNILLEINSQNINIKNYFIICKLILILENDTPNLAKKFYSQNQKIIFQINTDKDDMNDIYKFQIKDGIKKFDEYKEKIIYENILKNLKNFFGENINITEHPDLIEQSKKYQYDYVFNLFQKLIESKEKKISFQHFIDIINAEVYKDDILEFINKYIKDKKSPNKKIELIEKGQIDIDVDNKEEILIKQLNEEKIMVYIGKKLGIYSTNDLSLLFSINIDINIDIISPIIILKNGNILLITTENKNNNKKEDLITIINSKTFKIEQKIPLFLSKDIFSLIELSNDDIAYTNEIGLVIYTKKNGKYIFSKLIPYARGILKQINEDSFLSLGQMIIKFSIEDYSVIGAMPNFGRNHKLIKFKNDIYALYGGEIGGALSQSLICYLDINKFEIVFYRYLDRIVEDIIPLSGDNYFIILKWYVYTNSCESKIYEIVSKPIEYENTYGFIDVSFCESDNDDYEKIKALENVSYKQFIRLSDNKILLQKYYWVCLFEYKK